MRRTCRVCDDYETTHVTINSHTILRNNVMRSTPQLCTNLNSSAFYPSLDNVKSIKHCCVSCGRTHLVPHASHLTINVTFIHAKIVHRTHRTTTTFITYKVAFKSGFVFDLFNYTVDTQQRVVATNVTLLC